ncbi:hypothetical protein QCN37_gp80 [Arthrobacter phage Tatanka]|uniref:Helix-turn-helix DNA-binding domain protein n=1 Tax=Arthrobacter phage Tatanka TaxID=2250368 RepID=A0A2Z5HF89_9CAUD|nr:hypothetical protein QCN37_gp80 [Arthrobacter phage Tatanka]AXC38704.1 hypothetical protein SEA_TATANKA_80 [Arthrobacter phage Tatanka]
MGKSSPTKIQAKHLPASAIVWVLESNVLKDYGLYPSMYNIAKLFPMYPLKVVQAKLRNLEKKGVLEGCACGCSTSWWVL